MYEYMYTYVKTIRSERRKHGAVHLREWKFKAMHRSDLSKDSILAENLSMCVNGRPLLLPSQLHVRAVESDRRWLSSSVCASDMFWSWTQVFHVRELASLSDHVLSDAVNSGFDTNLNMESAIWVMLPCDCDERYNCLQVKTLSYLNLSKCFQKLNS